MQQILIYWQSIVFRGGERGLVIGVEWIGVWWWRAVWGVDVAVGVWEPSGVEVTVNEQEDSVLW